MNEECGGTISIARVVLVDFCAAQRASVVLTIEPTEQAKLAENVIALVENHWILIVIVADWTRAAGSLDLFFGWCGSERLKIKLNRQHTVKYFGGKATHGLLKEFDKRSLEELDALQDIRPFGDDVSG